MTTSVHLFLIILFNLIHLNAAELDKTASKCPAFEGNVVFIHDLSYYHISVEEEKKNLSRDLIVNMINNLTEGNCNVSIMATGQNRDHVLYKPFNPVLSQVLKHLNEFHETLFLEVKTDRIYEALTICKGMLPNETDSNQAIYFTVNANMKLDSDRAVTVFRELQQKNVKIHFLVIGGSLLNLAGFGGANVIFDGTTPDKLNKLDICRLYSEMSSLPSPVGSVCTTKQLQLVELTVLTVFDKSIRYPVFAKRAASVLMQLKSASNLTQYTFFLGDNAKTDLISTPNDVATSQDIETIIDTQIVPQLDANTGLNVDQALTSAFFLLTQMNPKIRPVIVLILEQMSDVDVNRTIQVAGHVKNHLNIPILIFLTNASTINDSNSLKYIASPSMIFKLTEFRDITPFYTVSCFCNPAMGKQFVTTTNVVSDTPIFGYQKTNYFADCYAVHEEKADSYSKAAETCKNVSDNGIPAIISSDFTIRFLHDQVFAKNISYFNSYLNIKRYPNSQSVFAWIDYSNGRLEMNETQLALLDPADRGDCVIATIQFANYSFNTSLKVVECNAALAQQTICQTRACQPDYPCNFEFAGDDNNFFDLH